MKKFVLAVAFSMFGVGTSVAADMAVKARPAPVVVAPSWTGFYIGAHAGWAQTDQDASMVALPAGFGAPAVVGGGVAGAGILPTSYDIGADGWVGGIHAGYNWQAGRWVIGVEADATYNHRNSAALQTLFATCCAQNVGSLTVTGQHDWLATARLRLGYTFDRLMVYGTGGVAFTDATYTARYTDFGVMGVATPPPVNFGGNKVGFAAGGGAEWLVAPNWLLRAEYLYYRFEGDSASLPIVGGNCTVAANCRFNVNSGDLEIHSVRAGLSYKF